MNALDIYKMAHEQKRKLASMGEALERRRAIAEGCTSKPLSADGGGFGSGDKSVKLLDFVSDVEEMEKSISEAQSKYSATLSCCVYMSGRLNARNADILERYYLAGKTIRAIAGEMAYSQGYVKQMKAAAEDEARALIVIEWDGKHTPVLGG